MSQIPFYLNLKSIVIPTQKTASTLLRNGKCDRTAIYTPTATPPFCEQSTHMASPLATDHHMTDGTSTGRKTASCGSSWAPSQEVARPTALSPFPAHAPVWGTEP